MAQTDALNDIAIGNNDPALFAIGKKWIEYAQSECDTNDIATAIWSAIAEVQRAHAAKAQPAGLQPVGTINRYGKRADGQPWHGILIREDGRIDLPQDTTLYANVQTGVGR
jgi:hypothetical protein